MGCCSRLKKECQLSLFSLEDTNGQTIDLHQSLAPKPRLLCGAIKACILCWFITFCTIEIFTDGRGLYWFIFLTHWGLLLMYLYMALTTFAFIRRVYLEKKYPERVPENNHTTLTRTISIVGVLGINIEVLIILIYWLTIYDGRAISFNNLEKHGILGFLLMIDVLVIHRVPIRIKHIFPQFAFCIVFLVWSVIHAVADIGHPESDNDPETDDDAIYSTVNWNKRPGAAGVMVGFLLLIVTPLIFFVLFGISLLIKPRYCSEVEEKKAYADEEEEGVNDE